MRTLIVSEFVSLDGVMQAPGGKDEDRDGGFEHGGWTIPFWHDSIGETFAEFMKDCDALLLGRRTYVTHAEAFEPMPAGDRFGDMMNRPKKYVVSKTLENPIWRDTTIIRDNVIDSIRALKNEPGKNILTDGSSQLVHAMIAADLVDELHFLVYPLILGSGKRALPEGSHRTFALKSATPIRRESWDSTTYGPVAERDRIAWTETWVTCTQARRVTRYLAAAAFLLTRPEAQVDELRALRVSGSAPRYHPRVLPRLPGRLLA